MSVPLKNWSDEEQRRFAYMYCVHSEDYVDIADTLGKSPSAMSRAAKQIGIRGHKGDVERYKELYKEDISPLLTPVRYDAPELPERPASKTKTSIKSLMWGDLQIPFHDKRALNILYQITDDYSPDELYAMGDILDFWQISKHRPPDERNLEPWEVDLQAQVDMIPEHTSTMIQLADPDYCEWRDGNHEDRYDRALLDMQTDPRLRHLLHLTRVREALDLHYILGLKEQGWVTKPYESDPTIIRDKLVLIHGNRTNKWFTRSLLDRFGLSVMCFHTHKFQNYTRRNLKGQEAGFGVGCMCSLNPHYDQYPDWHQGFAVVDWSRATTDSEWKFNVEYIRIHDGEAIFRGNHYVAD